MQLSIRDCVEVRCYQGTVTENPINTRDWRENPSAISRDWLNSREESVTIPSAMVNTDVVIMTVNFSSHLWRHASHPFSQLFYSCALRMHLSASSPCLWDFRFPRRRIWSLESSGMQSRVVTLKLTDVTEVRTTFIALIMEAVCTSKTSVNFYKAIWRFSEVTRLGVL
jgi:hypothetical protein